MKSSVPIKEYLESQVDNANSLVCVGLDPVLSRLPECVKELKNPVFEFNKAIIDSTHDIVCSYKVQSAFYVGQKLEDELEMTCSYIKDKYPTIPIILDFKRSDIKDVAEMYAKEAFERYGVDAVTVNPYMGGSTIEPFTRRKDKGTIVLCKTSNPDSSDIQSIETSSGHFLYQIIARKANLEWNSNKNVFLVVGATNPNEMKSIRTIAPDLTFLVPGVGTQGGDPEQVVKNGMDSEGKGLIINSSRSIIYASSGIDFDKKAREETLKLRATINAAREKALKELPYRSSLVNAEDSAEKVGDAKLKAISSSDEYSSQNKQSMR